MLYVSARWVVAMLVRLVFGLTIVGRDRIPASGPVVLAANHVGELDPFLVGAACRRRVHFMAKQELFRYPLLKHLLPRVGAFPVRRGEADREAIGTALKILKEGGVVGLFVEGTRNRGGDLLPIQSGAAMLAARSGAAVVPVGIRRKGRRIEVRVGSALNLPAGRADEPRRSVYQAINEHIASALRILCTG